MKKIICMLLSLLLITFLFSCNSSDDSSSGSTTNNNNQTASTDEVDDSITYALASISDNADNTSDIDQLSYINDVMQIGGSSSTDSIVSRAVYERLVTQDTACGSLDIENQTFTYVLDGSCDNLTGSVQYTFSGSGGAGSGQGTYTMTYNNVTDGTCTLNGSVTTTVNYASSSIAWTYTFNNMSICGETYNGSVSMAIDSSTGEITYELDTQNYAYQSGTIKVDTDINYDTESGVSGLASVDINGNTYSCTATGITFDPTCGLPTSGTLNVKTAAGNTVTLDFGNTSCTNKTVTYTLNGQTHTYDLTELETLLGQTT